MDFILINKGVFVINKMDCIKFNYKTLNKDIYKQLSILY